MQEGAWMGGLGALSFGCFEKCVKCTRIYGIPTTFDYVRKIPNFHKTHLHLRQDCYQILMTNVTTIN